VPESKHNNKTGRNDPCPCGSGKKFKKCCLIKKQMPGLISPMQLPPEVKQEIQKVLHAEKTREKIFGKVKSMIHAEAGENRVVAVGDTIFVSDKNRTKTFTDFLLDYIKGCLGGAWGENEIRKPLEERHQIMKWHDAFARHSHKFQRDANGLIPIPQNGVIRSYLSLAYDLYVLKHHQSLQGKILQRLKQKDQFQGARYELFATATMIRSGFTIEFEDESDPKSKHPEFIATHKTTGQKISVEAKSKHRAGVLGRPGERVQDANLKNKIAGLLNDALQKPTEHPYVIFVDANLPGNKGEMELRFNEMEKTVRELSPATPENPAPFAMVELTNFPYHYDEEMEITTSLVSCIVPLNQKIKMVHPNLLQEIHLAAAKHGNIPKEFD